MATKHEKYMEFLTAEGYSPQKYGENDLTFKKEGRSYVVFSHEDTPNYFNMVLPIELKEMTDHDRPRLLEAVNSVNQNFKAIKVTLLGSWVAFGVEFFLPEPDGYKQLLEVSFAVIGAGFNLFVQTVDAQNKALAGK